MRKIILKATLVLVLLITLLSLAGCLAGPNELVKEPDDEGRVAGFWRGLWHGFISPITFIISLFSKQIHFYEVHNNGGWYDAGFVLGAGILSGAGAAGSRGSRE